jgi:glycosyltransferase involved in cell wall biosynthesis
MEKIQEPLKILFVTESFRATKFGVEQVISHLMRYCKAHDAQSALLAANIDDCTVPGHQIERIPLYRMGLARNTIGRALRWHHRMCSFICKEIQFHHSDVVHVHGAMTFVQRSAVKAARKMSVPVVISPHGMLQPWLWRQRGMGYFLLKRLYWNMVMRPVLKQASYIHSITQQESESALHEFPGTPQIRIPNAIDVDEFEAVQVPPDPEHYLLFLGRLHPKKGVDLLIDAFSRLEKDEIRLIIAGPDFDATYTKNLKEMVDSLGLSGRVTFAGPVHGDKKNNLLRRAWCTVVPSHSDVVALVNLESAASFTPTITTTMTGLDDWENGGGLLVEPDLDEITAAIREVCLWSLEERMFQGKRARDFVKQRYSWDVIGNQWMNAYRMFASGNTHHV